mmetsp:Transcript_6834/g.26395  ORF Transcript_6834/g.26395 Transcript_6834/m.26395 type:complete len:201 (-) Transcript_6834:891-1493(-)
MMSTSSNSCTCSFAFSACETRALVSFRSASASCLCASFSRFRIFLLFFRCSAALALSSAPSSSEVRSTNRRSGDTTSTGVAFPSRFRMEWIPRTASSKASPLPSSVFPRLAFASTLFTSRSSPSAVEAVFRRDRTGLPRAPQTYLMMFLRKLKKGRFRISSQRHDRAWDARRTCVLSPSNSSSATSSISPPSNLLFSFFP